MPGTRIDVEAKDGVAWITQQEVTRWVDLT
jgi:hypothetical protein